MRNDGHVSDVCRTVHQLTDLVHGKVDHDGGVAWGWAFEAGVKDESEWLSTGEAESYLNQTGICCRSIYEAEIGRLGAVSHRMITG